MQKLDKLLTTYYNANMMTIKEIEHALGYKVEVIDEPAKKKQKAD